MAVVLIIGPFFAGHLRPSETTQGRASMLANMRYHTAVIISLFTACGTLASSSRKLMRLGAHAERILELEDTAKQISAGARALTLTHRPDVPPKKAGWYGHQLVCVYLHRASASPQLDAQRLPQKS